MPKKSSEKSGGANISMVYNSNTGVTKATVVDHKGHTASFQQVRGEMSPREARDNHERLADMAADIRRRLDRGNHHS